MQADLKEIQRSLGVLFQPGDTIELRSLGDRVGNGYYRNQDTLAQAALDLSNAGQNVYCCLNPVDGQLYARRADQFGSAKRGAGTKDQDIPRRRWLLIDVDAVRPAGISATDPQRSAAITLARTLYTWLQDQLGSSCLVCGDSGNGAHILIRLPDVIADDRSGWICERFLQQLDQRFSNAQAKIDCTTHNASRICTLYGTVKRKGSDIPEQPHRGSRLVRVPEPLQPVDFEQLAAMVEPYQAKPTAPQTNSNGSGLDIEQLLEQHQCEYNRDDQYRTGSGELATRYVLEVCPWDRSHDDRAAWIIRWQNGAIAAGCQHDGCSGKGWEDLKAAWQLPASAGISAADIILPQASTSHLAHTSHQSYIEPPVLDQAAYYGPIGQIVQGIRPHTEAAPAAVLCCTLAYFGNAIGRRYFVLLDQEHYAKLYISLVGATGSGRKGTADVQARRIVAAIDPAYSLLQHSGLTTGEGLLLVLDENRDGIYPRPAIFTEREFAAVLKRAERKGNTLSMFIRDAWDNEVLANSTKKDPLRIDDHHIGICAHVTPAELKRLLSDTDVANGFCNRFLWIYCRRDERKPGVHGFQAADYPQQIGQLQAVMQDLQQRYIDAGQQPQQIPFDPQAGQLWRSQLYGQLDIDADEDTLLTLMCSRQAQQVARLALIFALADGQLTIQTQHLQAACAIASYVWESVDYLLSRPWWGDSGNVHDPAGMAPRLIDALQRGPMMRTDISVQVFHRHRTAKEINALRDLLEQRGQIRIEQQGKAELWHLLP